MTWGFNMIRYNKRISIIENKYGLRLESDRGEIYELMPINYETNQAPVTSWWDKQAQTDLRRLQLDCIVKEYWRQNGPLKLFLVYKKGEGYSQPHDIVLAHDDKHNLWILSTEQHTWFEPSKDTMVFNVDNAMGSISNESDRLGIYEVIDGLLR